MRTGERMLQAQGLQPIEPYKTLQLRPDAPRDLIDEVYWCLIGSANRGRATAVTNKRIAELNDAYAFLTDDGRRTEYDAAIGFVKRPAGHRRRLFGRSRVPSAARLSHYEVLCVDREATDDVIAIAYGVLSRRPPTEREGIGRARLQEAYRVLTQRYLRAQYDGRTDGDDAPPMLAAPAPVDAPSVSMAAPASWEEEPPPRGAPDGERDAHTGAEPRKLIPWRRRAHESSTHIAPAASPSADRSGAGATTADGTATHATRPDSSPILLRLAVAPPHEADRSGLSQEASSRLLSLSDGSPPVARSSRDDDVSAAPNNHNARAEIVFTAGPRAGQQVFIEDTVSIDDGTFDAGEHCARISAYGAKFAFRIATGAAAAINGDPMTLPLVFLDDGDVIALGVHELLFVRLPETDAHDSSPSSRSG